jgi:hypothetical protein
LEEIRRPSSVKTATTGVIGRKNNNNDDSCGRGGSLDVVLRWNSGRMYYTIVLAFVGVAILVENVQSFRKTGGCDQKTKSDDVQWTRFDKYVSAAVVKELFSTPFPSRLPSSFLVFIQLP